MAKPAMHILGDDELKFYKPAVGTDSGSQLSTAELLSQQALPAFLQASITKKIMPLPLPPAKLNKTPIRANL
jgi:hypothetical protein